MTIINRLLGAILDALLYPFKGLPPLVGLAVVSLLIGIGMLLVFKATSNQKRIAEAKNRIQACLYEIRLFNDDLRSILRSQWRILGHNLDYLRCAFVPLLWMIIPLAFVFSQLQAYYGYRGLTVGEQSLVKVTLRDGWEADRALVADTVGGKPAIRLEAPPGLRVESAGVWSPSLMELAWRIAAEAPGEYELLVTAGGTPYAKRVHVSDALGRRSPVRVRAGLLRQLQYPSEDPLPGSGRVKSIRVDYPERRIEILGWGVHWLFVFFALTVVFAFALKGRFKVAI